MSGEDRQLYGYDSGFEGWEHSTAGYVTDYMLSLTCVTCFVYVIIVRRRMGALWRISVTSHSVSFALFCLFEAITFGAAGIAHQLLDTYYHNGEMMGKRWGMYNSAWMYWWFVAICNSPLASMALNSAVLNFNSTTLRPTWLTYVSYLVGICVSFYEAWLMFTYQLPKTGTAAAALAIGASLFGIIVLAIDGASFRNAKGWMVVGMVFRLSGYLVVAFAPESCKEVGSMRYGCPFPENLNEKVWFHCLLMVGVVFCCKAVVDIITFDLYGPMMMNTGGAWDFTTQYNEPKRRGDCRSCECAVQ